MVLSPNVFVEYFMSMIRMFLHSMLSKNYLKRYHMEEHRRTQAYLVILIILIFLF